MAECSQDNYILEEGNIAGLFTTALNLYPITAKANWLKHRHTLSTEALVVEPAIYAHDLYT